MTDSARLEALRRLKDDFPLFAAECLKIKAKNGDIIALRLNRAQLYLHAKLEEQRLKTGKVRVLLLKGRQTGFSTAIGARFYHRTSLNRGVQTYILTHEQDATNNLFDMVDRFHKHSPLRPSTALANAKELYFDKLDSGYAVGTAGTKAIGRSRTIQLFHGSEVAFWPNATGHFAGVVQAIPDLPDTEVILESTANGVSGEFHERWQRAQAGIGDYEAIFVPWFWSEEYRREVLAGFEMDDIEVEYARVHGLVPEQMVWRRAKIAELKDESLFKQEYPATADEAFQLTGHDSYIKPEDVLSARKTTLEGLGPLVMGVDPSRFGDDRFSVAWRRGRKVSKVESRTKLGTVEAVSWLKQIIDVDKPAKVFMDVGGGGDRIYDIMAAWGAPYDKLIVLVNFGSPAQQAFELLEDGAKKAGPKNRRAEMWQRSRDWLQQVGGADIPDLDSLQSDACGPAYGYDLTTQQLVLESKEHMRARHVRSPDEWDAIVLTFAEPVKDPRPQPAERPRVYTIGGDDRNAWLGS